MNLATGCVVDIVQVEEQSSYVLQLHFSDGHLSTVDFGPFLRRSQNPQTRQFLDRAMFRSYEVRDGNLVWGDYDMCFAIENLYVGSVEAPAATATPVALTVAESGIAYAVKPDSSRRRTHPAKH